MMTHRFLTVVTILGFAVTTVAQENAASNPIELEVLKGYVGVWDAEIEVWPSGPDSDSIKFKGVETNRPYGEYWIASDFDSEYGGQTMKVHSIIGYDLDKKKMVGTVIDHGPYAATMTGEYDEESKTVSWITNAKEPNGKPIKQKTLITDKNAKERVLVLMSPSKEKGDFIKFMQIRFIRQE